MPGSSRSSVRRAEGSMMRQRRPSCRPEGGFPLRLFLESDLAAPRQCFGAQIQVGRHRIIPKVFPLDTLCMEKSDLSPNYRSTIPWVNPSAKDASPIDIVSECATFHFRNRCRRYKYISRIDQTIELMVFADSFAKTWCKCRSSKAPALAPPLPLR
jgi:hypothetical protein